MSISKQYNIDKTRIEIMHIMQIRPINEFSRIDIGKLLNELGKFHGYESSNKLVRELSLDKYDIKEIEIN
jgi:hypothetical protein